MQIQLTNEEVLEMGQVFGDIFLKIAPPEDVLSRFTPEEVLSNFTPQERLAGLGAEERLAGLGAEERLAGLGAQERLAGLDPQVIAAYLKGIQQPPAVNAT
ncbi:MAG: hypothetical protein ACPGWR_27295 [Ardenticatenaceae bacterium]